MEKHSKFNQLLIIDEIPGLTASRSSLRNLNPAEKQRSSEKFLTRHRDVMITEQLSKELLILGLKLFFFFSRALQSAPLLPIHTCFPSDSVYIGETPLGHCWLRLVSDSDRVKSAASHTDWLYSDFDYTPCTHWGFWEHLCFCKAVSKM